ncbi:MAG: hypothetical protein ACKN93_04695, partial [Candidatus Limnocylindrus sp.]
MFKPLYRRIFSVFIAISFMLAGQPSLEVARGVGGLTVSIVTFDVIGFDSNTPSTGQKQFPVGARV